MLPNTACTKPCRFTVANLDLELNDLVGERQEAGHSSHRIVALWNTGKPGEANIHDEVRGVPRCGEHTSPVGSSVDRAVVEGIFAPGCGQDWT
eukprot:scaffold1766_cov401-Prasinococcus_capsulatus_cf.AAC.32